ncbi:restriction endonuclease PLD domain-containing protein [Alkalicoccus daliensis]|uniref:Restriction endonuclease type II NgoFVII C-terminal B3-like DNA-binding domain-containing protein n=1 Tax=Alkalicoccus daliensis TaxID=745820 RepID=A0A1H0E9T3_9BACI|nr:restriction endonuclease PLD domain-containing protein [Alkalicoccus daliensis]SDN79056.1 hypothetical protein SAMN04488053_103255 [Alkalicoccus daliensis]
MFINSQPNENQSEYIELLRLVGSLSNMFSESPVPYLYYRAAENIFCKAFGAENLSRGDVSADASFENLGIGLKTFLHKNGNTLQKVAEFNRGASDYQSQDSRDIVKTISSQRNERIKFTMRAHDLDEMIYHLVTREEMGFNIYEERMDLVDINNIRGIINKGNNIYFHDGIHKYKFDKSKSTLSKRFITKTPINRFEVSILSDPYELILQSSDQTIVSERREETYEQIYLPLYSTKSSKKEVQQGAGLNQWNAKGRPRHQDEIYIPIPKWIHNSFPDFFPYNLKAYQDAKRNNTSYESKPFKLELPNGKELTSKICQENGKALMSNPNRELGNWLLRHVLQVNPRELVTYDMLETIGIDSVIVSKINQFHYRIDFAAINSYENFEEEYK